MFKEENTFWIALWTLVATVIISCTILVVYSGHLGDQKVVAMVEKGANPLVAKCALVFSNEGARPLMCIEALKHGVR